MPTLGELERAVDAAFVDTGRNLSPWPDPHLGAMPLDEEYSRVSDPAKYLLFGARHDAWLRVLVDHDVVDVELEDTPTWLEPHPGLTGVTAERIVPRQPDGLALVVCRTSIEGVQGAGMVFGVGDPIQDIARFPDCGCDACDSGSQDVLDEIDRHIRSMVAGTFRHLRRATSTITVLDDDGWSARNMASPRRWLPGKRQGPDADPITSAIADPTGWEELRGPPWI